MANRGSRVGVATVFLMVAGVLFPSSAYAAVGAGVCSGKTEDFMVKVYRRGAAAVPLRCGTDTYGFNHVQTRWNASYDAQIAPTIARGDVTPDGRVYVLFGEKCRQLFRVLANPGPNR